ncbi:MAG: sigma-54-dependent Fis family transcriptional regulator [Candidatus Aminicenantes bacterium]|uniref:Response regulator of zinc sigma-54-dependent two-component system n=1 Tax=Candidatus Saccharicenans subterraneus TaxID=2508984 RepID=A0A3E2BK89_9BACT|nr:sigma-54-dependent Fis family transcriptional regulator [Candidatus Aminicenantes bacterium]RFT15151.1 MAG: Response regulator of zinc sigma-54-dependent two-component system [Candidatus Saccharicenans subterraneum]
MNDNNAMIHLIDDEPIIHDVLGQLLESEGFKVEISASGEEALKKFEEQKFDLTLLDLLMPGMDGLEVLKQVRKIDPEALVIIITAYASVESALTAIKMGAYDYIQKPFKNDELLMTIKRALEHRRLHEENIRLRHELKKKFSFENIIGKSQAMMNVFELIKAAAPTRSTILIQGESGTGKELVARAIHLNSDRARHPFVVVNSGSLPPDLLESHLFGHVKGAFTGAVTDKKGLFEAADRGTIFFDEISSISLETQVKLLRVMQDKEFMRLGGTRTIKVDVRIIAATNTDLEELIEQKAFRKDLFYRLNVIKIELPPLRARKEDIPLLVKHFIELYNAENQKQVEGVSEDVMEILMDYDWPGNVRELENVLERAVVLCKSRVITREALPPFLLSGKKIMFEELDNASLDLKEKTAEFQKKLILTALEKSGGVQKKAAELLGLKPTTLNEMIKRLKISDRMV